MSLNLVRPHVTVLRQAFGFSEDGGVPESGVDPGNRPGGGNQLRPGQTAELVAIPGIPDELQKQKTVGAAEGSGTRKQPRGQFSFQRGEEKVGGKFAFKDAQFSGPLPALGDVATDFENISFRVTLPGGH